MNGRGKSRQNKAKTPSLLRIPQFEASVKLKKEFRFLQVSASTSIYNITRGNMLNLLLSNNSGSTTSARLIAGVKLNRIQVWSNPISSGTFVTSSVEWLSVYGPSSEQSDSSTSSAVISSVLTSPPPQSVASYWSMTGSNESEVIMRLTIPTTNIGSTMVAIWVDMILMDDDTPVTVTTSNSGVTSQLYANCLDGTAGGLQPVSLKFIS